MSAHPWTDTENDLIVADYFSMLAEEIAGRSFNKAAHRKALLPLLPERTHGSIEFKHQNISAVMKGLGEVWIKGYKPDFNEQASLMADRSISFHCVVNFVLRSDNFLLVEVERTRSKF